MIEREVWLDWARKLDWSFSYVRPEEVFPVAAAGAPWLSAEEWAEWDEPFKTTYHDYVITQHQKNRSVDAVHQAIGNVEDYERLSSPWLNALKLHAAALPLAEFAAVIGNLRGARFGRAGAWRAAATLGALDEMRHTEIPLLLMHPLVRHNRQFDWTHRFYHSNDWVAIAGRHLFDELLLSSDAIEFAIATNFVFETGFTNLQFIGLSSLAHDVGDRMFETMVGSIQSDEARHAQIGGPVLAMLVKKDRARAQYLVDKWFWRSWLLFAVVTGFSMDYLTPVEQRKRSFKEFVQEWVIDQYLESLKTYGLEKPWYWSFFESSLDYFHHMLYASAYTYRATLWFDLVVPGPNDRAWLRQKYPRTWESFDPVWKQVTKRWAEADIGNDLAVHGTSIVSFCALCQLVLCQGTPEKNTAVVVEREGVKRIFCSEPCRWIFEQEPERYVDHKDVVHRVLAGEAPPNLIAMLRNYFGLRYEDWGKDAFKGDYPWIKRGKR